jgi:bifunctional DNA-binding transcriptional regulator/antitoxin component of YhaV-PrlF toxin-antitoxin module
MWTVTVDQDGVINLPQEVLESLDLKTHDYVEFVSDNDKSQIVVKKLPVKRVLVETVSTFRMRYVVELQQHEPDEYALDTVVMGDAVEFSQKYLDETVVTHREVSADEVLAMCDIDNDYVDSWSDDKKFEVFVTALQNENASKVITQD